MSEYGSDVEEEPTYEIIFDDDETGKKDKYLRRDGRAHAKFENGDSFEGEYVDGKRQGHGVYTYKNGAKYDGEYKEGKKEGQGTFITLDGGKYVGHWKNNQREGEGSYYYRNGDIFSGNWKAGLKHGKGVYYYHSSSSRIEGEWSNGVLMHGTWLLHDGSKYCGKFEKNKPSGVGIYIFANGSGVTGQHAQGVFLQKLFASPPVSALPPTPIDKPDPVKVAARLIAKCVSKVDHFEGIYRLKKTVEGCPNLRKVGEYPVFAVGQPTLTGFRQLFEWAQNEHSIEKFIWVNLRSEPIVYVNDSSYTPRDKHKLNDSILEGAGDGTSSSPLSPASLASLETMLVNKLRKDVVHRGGVHVFYKETWAELNEDKQNISLSENVKLPTKEEEEEMKENPEEAENMGVNAHIKSISQIYHILSEEGVDVSYHRLPIAEEGSITGFDFDSLLKIIKTAHTAGDGCALIFNDLMGRNRATFATLLYALYKRVQHSLNKQEEEEPEERNEEEAGEAGGKAFDEIEVPEYDEFDPNYKLGQYSLIMKLARAIPNGESIKAEVDESMDRCKSMHHIRESLLYAKEQYDRELNESRKLFWKENAVLLLEKYAQLILFHTYLKTQVDSKPSVDQIRRKKEEQKLRAAQRLEAGEEEEEEEEEEHEEEEGGAQYGLEYNEWLKDKQEWLDIIGDRHHGPISQFEWN